MAKKKTKNTSRTRQKAKNKKLPLLKIIVTSVVAVIIGLLLVIAMQPGEFKVTRSALINASAFRAFSQVNDFHKWQAWSPWAKLDPMAKNTYAGAPAGEGAMVTWQGNKEVGSGKMTIVESKRNERIQISIEFYEPFEAAHNVEFNFAPEGNKTNVTWSMYGQNNFLAKAMGLFMNCEEMLGGYFEEGLANVKSIAEAEAIAAATTLRQQRLSSEEEQEYQY